MELIYFLSFWGIVALAIGIWGFFDMRRDKKKECAQ